MNKYRRKITKFSKFPPGKYKLKKCGEKTSTYLFIGQLDFFENFVGDKRISSVDNKNKKIFDDKIIRKKLEETASYETKRKKKKSIITNLILLFVNIALVVLIASTLIKNADDASLSSLFFIQGKNLYYLLIGLAMFVLFFILDALVLNLFIRKTTGKSRPWLSFRASVYGKYYESVTPFSIGGQPAQIIAFAKGGISPGISTTIPILKVTIVNFVAIVLAIISFIFIGPSLKTDSSFSEILFSIVKIVAYIGAIINTLYFIAMILVANSKVLGRKVARAFIKIGVRFKFVKNYRKAYDKFMRQVFEFQNSMQYLKNNGWLLISTTLLTALQSIILATMPFIVCIALSDITFASFGVGLLFWLECVVKYYLCYMAASFIPLPGGTGMNEIVFIILFVPIIGSNFIVWGFLSWRILTYYSTLIQGLGFIIFDMIKSSIERPAKPKLQKRPN